jgi:hypothetical protein
MEGFHVILIVSLLHAIFFTRRLLKFWQLEHQNARIVANPNTATNMRPSDASDTKLTSLGPPASPTISHLINEPYGYFELANSPDILTTIDVVAVHGLQGHPFRTWTHENGNLWLKDDLPEDVPSARILTFGYDSTIAFSRSVATIEDIALQLLTGLYIERENDKAVGARRPIVFVCHSLGGIVVKKALVLAHERSSNPGFKDILDNTRAIAFLAVPHRGSKTADYAHTLANALKVASIGTSTNTALVAGLRKNSPMLEDISKQFVERGKDLKIYTFYEMKKILGMPDCVSLPLISQTYAHRHTLQVVDDQSARIGVPNEDLIPVLADHRSITRWPGRRLGMYKTVGLSTARLINEAVEAAEKCKPSKQILQISSV